MDYSIVTAIVSIVVCGFGLVLFLRRGVHVRGVDITYFGGRAKVDELIVGADREHRAEDRHAAQGNVATVEPDAEKLPPSEKPTSIEPKREEPGELAA